MSRSMLCALVLVFIAPAARADEAEDKAIAVVEKLKGEITRDDKKPGKPVVAVVLVGADVTDASLKELASLKNLAVLHLHKTKVTGAGLKDLGALKNLSELDLFGTKVTDEDMKEL